MPDDSWYVRDRNKIMGPFDRAQLEALRHRGQLARFHQVSQDRQTWVSASTLSDLFAPSQAPAVREPASDVVPAAPEWYYSSGRTPSGPVSAQALSDLLRDGAVTPETLVWTKGLPAWIPLRDSGLAGANHGLGQPHSAGLPVIITSPGRSQAAAPIRTVFAFALTYWLGIACSILGVFLFFGGTLAFLGASMARRDAETGGELAVVGIGTCLVGIGCNFAAFIIGLMKLHRAWTLIQPLRQTDPTEVGMPTPGIAIGLLFIPIFNIYWIFISFYGIAIRANKYLAHRRSEILPMKEGLALITCILWIYSFVPYATFFVSFFLMIVNYLFIVDVIRIGDEIEARGTSV